MSFSGYFSFKNILFKFLHFGKRNSCVDDKRFARSNIEAVNVALVVKKKPFFCTRFLSVNVGFKAAVDFDDFNANEW